MIKLHLDCVFVENKLEKAIVTFCDVKRIQIDDQEDTSELMIEGNGEVLTLDFKNNQVNLIIEWNNFKKHTSCMRFYTIYCADIDVQIIH